MIWIAGIIAILVLIVLGRGAVASRFQRMAARELDRGAISAAQRWLAWSDWISPGDGQVHLLMAKCFRQLKQDDRFLKALETAKKDGSLAAPIRQELRLREIQAGQVGAGAENELLDLVEAGVSPHDASAVFVYGYLYRQEPEKAKRVLDAWAADFPDEAKVAYMQGIYWRSLPDPARAETDFRSALAREPRHELARIALAELYEDQHQLVRSLEQWSESASLFPASEIAQVGVARLLRKMGRLSEARAELEPLASQPNATDEMQLEMSQIEFESGNYKEAAQRFRQAHLDQSHDYHLLLDRATMFAREGYTTSAEPLFLRARTAATAMALAGNSPGAEWLFRQVDGSYGRLRRIHDLRVRLGIEPNDRTIIDELQQLDAYANAASNAVEPPQRTDTQVESEAVSGPDLYVQHCTVCHGPRGDGNGVAARHLFPRPRNFRAQRFRLVSTVNSVPSLADVDAVIQRGMPGTSMPSFPSLNDKQRRQLSEEVLRLHREGLRDEMIELLRDAEETVDDDELRQLVQLRTTPGQVVSIPKMGTPDSQAIARGKDTFFKLGCDRCHENQVGDSTDQLLFDDRGHLARPRDLAYDPFKGGHEPESIYLRIRLGMPGTLHPSCGNLPDQQLVDLVQFCRSLSREPKRMLTNHQRRVGTSPSGRGRE
jgi:mono/diheme cytochrome c family protein